MTPLSRGWQRFVWPARKGLCCQDYWGPGAPVLAAPAGGGSPRVFAAHETEDFPDYFVEDGGHEFFRCCVWTVQQGVVEAVLDLVECTAKEKRCERLPCLAVIRAHRSSNASLKQRSSANINH
ncbi:hypothetical protein MTO96_039934 [Rhipicephalus appendiculatus]